MQWTVDGIPISAAPNDQLMPVIATDGAGGAIMAWQDGRSIAQSPDIYAQRVDASGMIQWTLNGVAVSTAANYQANPVIASDGAGGAIIAWWDSRSGSNYDIYAQDIDSSGAPLWTANGVAISTAAYDQQYPVAIADGGGGAIIAWQDQRTLSYDIYAQRIDAGGVVQWTVNGVAISTAGNGQVSPTIVSDGAGGAIITWEDGRSGTNSDIYAQRIDSSGVVQWAANGVAVTTAANNQLAPSAISDGAGGAIITWQDRRTGTNTDIYAQHINAAGVAQWAADGVAICTAAYNQNEPTIAGDGTGGAIITWYDIRGVNYDIYAQRINVDGVVQWMTDGIPISSAPNVQSASVIVGTNAGGAFITWADYRSGVEYDIYAQQVNANGVLGEITSVDRNDGLPSRFMLAQNYPNPFNPSTHINFTLPQAAHVRLSIIDILGREIAVPINDENPAGNHTAQWDGTNSAGTRVASGVYLYRLEARPIEGGGGFVSLKKLTFLK